MWHSRPSLYWQERVSEGVCACSAPTFLAFVLTRRCQSPVGTFSIAGRALLLHQSYILDNLQVYFCTKHNCSWYSLLIMVHSLPPKYYLHNVWHQINTNNWSYLGQQIKRQASCVCLKGTSLPSPVESDCVWLFLGFARFSRSEWSWKDEN